MSKEITTEMLLEMIEKTGWDIGTHDNVVRVNTVAHNMELQRKVADLEAKLAESEEKVKAMETLREMVSKDSKLNFKRYIDMLAKNEQLEQQLAEKEETIEDIKDHQKDLCLRCGGLTHIEYEQDKISFAVEQLEKVKELCKKKFDWWENSEWEGDIYDKSDVSNAYFDIEANIDNKIEELKKEIK